jgi:hypothetical protein
MSACQTLSDGNNGHPGAPGGETAAAELAIASKAAEIVTIDRSRIELNIDSRVEPAKGLRPYSMTTIAAPASTI